MTVVCSRHIQLQEYRCNCHQAAQVYTRCWLCSPPVTQLPPASSIRKLTAELANGRLAGTVIGLLFQGHTVVSRVANFSRHHQAELKHGRNSTLEVVGCSTPEVTVQLLEHSSRSDVRV